MKKRLPAFLSGALCAILVLSLALTALAASGAVSFNGINISLFNQQVVAAGEEYTGQNGAKVPSSITYTDELGGTTNYLSVRQIAQLLDTDLYWNRAANSLVLGYREALPTGGNTIDVGDVTITTGGTSVPVVAGPAPTISFTEIPAALPADGAKFVDCLPQTRWQTEGRSFFRQIIECHPGNGNTVSVTVTNHNTDNKEPLIFNLYQARTVGRDTSLGSSVKVEPGKTVTRTFQLADDAPALTNKLGVDVFYSMDTAKTDMSVTISQFTP